MQQDVLLSSAVQMYVSGQFDEAEKLLRIIFFKSMKEQGLSDETIAAILRATQGVADGV